MCNFLKSDKYCKTEEVCKKVFILRIQLRLGYKLNSSNIFAQEIENVDQHEHTIYLKDLLC